MILRSNVRAEAMAPPTLRQVSGMETSSCRYMHKPREDGLVDVGQLDERWLFGNEEKELFEEIKFPRDGF